MDKSKSNIRPSPREGKKKEGEEEEVEEQRKRDKSFQYPELFLFSLSSLLS
jgi:hypothetical protein